MNRIVISIQNSLLSEAITKMLWESNKFEIFEILQSKISETAEECKILRPNVLLMEVTYGSQTTLEKRLETVQAVRVDNPDCKVVLLCDENSSPELAERVKTARYKGLIDTFFYASVSLSYLKDVLESL